MQERRTAGPTGHDGDARRSVPVDEPVHVDVQPVVGQISAPVLGSVADDGEANGSGSGESSTRKAPAFELPWGTLWRPSIGLARVAVASVIGTAVAVIMSDVIVGAGCGLLVWFAGSIPLIINGVPFSFGEGFVGYRPDTAWPRGVQEDDDVRWDWRVRDAPSDDASDEVAEDITISVR